MCQKTSELTDKSHLPNGEGSFYQSVQNQQRVRQMFF